MRGPLIETLNGNRYIGVAVCALTKYIESAGKTIHILKLMEIEIFEFLNFRLFFLKKKTCISALHIIQNSSFFMLFFHHSRAGNGLKIFLDF